MKTLLSLLTRLLLAVAFTCSAGWIAFDVLPAAEATRLQRECPPMEKATLSPELGAALKQLLAERPQKFTINAYPDELRQSLDTFGYSPNVAGLVRLLTDPIATGDARLDLLAAYLRAHVLSRPGALHVSEDNNMALWYNAPDAPDAPATPELLQQPGLFADIYVNENGTLQAYMVNNIPQTNTP